MFFRRSVVVSDAQKHKELLTRGVANVIPKELAEKKLASGQELRVYLGIDPTGAQLHLGHSVPLRKLKAFADLGHKVVFVVGSFTAMIGDPSGRDTMREPLTRFQVEENFKEYRRQAAKILDFSKVEVRYNHEWLEKLQFADIVKLTSHFTVQQMIQRDMFEKRLAQKKPIALSEFLYPVMVGYDSVVLDVDCELGGSDQEFNMLAGRQLQSALKKRDKFVLATRLIEGTDGRKMSKTYNNSVYLDDSPKDMFGKLMSLSDNLIPIYFEACTDVPEKRIAEILTTHPKEAKMALAQEIVRLYHGEKAAVTARNNFVATFSKGEVPTEVVEILVQAELKVSDFVEAKIVTSNTEMRRLIEEGAVSIAGTGEKISDLAQVVEGTILKIGKYRFVKIIRKERLPQKESV